MPIDKNGKEPGQKGYTFAGMDPKKKAQAQAITIALAKRKGKVVDNGNGAGQRTRSF